MDKIIEINSESFEKEKDNRKINSGVIFTSLLILFILIGSNFMKNTLNPVTQNILKTNILLRNIIIFLIIFFSVNAVGNISNDNKLHSKILFRNSVILFFLYSIFCKMEYYYQGIILFLTIILTLTHNIEKQKKENIKKKHLRFILKYTDYLIGIIFFIFILKYIIKSNNILNLFYFPIYEDK